MKKINYILAAFVAIVMVGCTDYDGTKLKEMTDSNLTLVKSTAQVKNFSLSGTITDYVDCYLTITNFDGEEKKVNLISEAVTSDVYESTNKSGVFSMKYTIERNNTALSGKSCTMTFKPGILNCSCVVARPELADTTYSYSYTFTECITSVTSTTTLTEEDIQGLIDQFNSNSTKATFNYFANEKGWPVAYIKSDDPKE